MLLTFRNIASVLVYSVLVTFRSNASSLMHSNYVADVQKQFFVGV